MKGTDAIDEHGRWLWPAAVFLIFAMLLALNPGGFSGGGGDDWHYLEAARCWRDHGPCLPNDHWQGRWPLIAPLAAIIALLGENRWTVGLPDLAAAIAALLLIAYIGDRLFGRPAGWVAAALLAAAPVIAMFALDPNVDLIEFACLLVATSLLLGARGPRALLSGLAAGLAFQVRETSLASLPPLLIGLWLASPPNQRIRRMLMFTGGFLAPLAIELMIYANLTGDPLWRRHLSLAHARIASTELASGTAVGGSPLFNLDLVRGWSRQSGIHIHWTIDGIANLGLDPDTGLLLLCLPLAAIEARSRLSPGDKHRALLLAVAGAFVLLVLIFGLAIDPKPRTMLVPLAVAALLLGGFLCVLVRGGNRFIAATVVLVISAAAFSHALLAPRWGIADSSARQWMAAHPAQIEIGDKTRRNLALVATAEALPPIGSGRPLLLVETAHDCADSATSLRIPPGSVTVERSAPLVRWTEYLPRPFPSLCLFRYRRTGAVAAIEAALGGEQRFLARPR